MTNLDELTIMVKLTREEADQAMQELIWLNSNDNGLHKIEQAMELAMSFPTIEECIKEAQFEAAMEQEDILKEEFGDVDPTRRVNEDGNQDR
jgi:virulence-associated protein VapD